MAFWTENTIEPQRKFRFHIQMNDDIMWWAKSVTQPSPDISVSEHQLINHKIKYPGIATWNDIDITKVDVGDTGRNLISDLSLKYGYAFLESTDVATGLAKTTGGPTVRPLTSIRIIKYNSDGDRLETWTLINPFIKAIKYGDLDYSSDELLEITLTVAYDSATLD